MSRSVDDRVVQMQFNNRQFESGVQQSLGTLEKLKSALNFDKSEKSMSSLERAFKNFDLSTFGENIQKIADRFSTLGIIGDQVVRRLTDAFLGLTGQITSTVKAMTIDQISAGWGKYEQKTSSVQTIMNATGKSIDEVNGYLDKLMWFSDETSYGFTDMTAALGQLTTAGGEIENLIPMIEGIANATAYAGKGPAEFSRAIYNLNQSYSSGALKYMDWKSLELAGVASKELKQTLIDTAVAMGKISKGEVTIGNFAEKLKENWADTEVMEVGFGKFAQATEEAFKLVQSGEFDTASEAYESLAGNFDEIYYKAARSAQEAKSFAEVIDATKDAVSSGWMKTFELLFGNYEEAKVLWTDMANSFWEIFTFGADSRNELLEEWHNFTVGGYNDFRDAIHNVLEALISAQDVLDNIVHGILPELDSTHLQKFTEGFKQFSVKAKIFFSGELPEGAEQIENVKGSFKNLQDELMAEDKAFGNVQSGFQKVLTAGEMFRNGISGIVHLVNIARKGFLTLKNSLSPLGQVFKALGTAALKIFDAFGHLFEVLDESIEITDGFKSSIEGVAKSIADFITKAGDKISGFIYNLLGFDEATGKVKIFTDSFGGLKDAVDKFKSNKHIQDFLDTINGIKNGFSFLLREGIGALTSLPKLLPTIGSALSKVGGAILSITGFIGRIFTKINDATKSGSLLSSVINLLVAGFKALGKVLTPVWETIKNMFGLLSAGNFEGFRNIMAGLFSGVGAFGALSIAKSGKGFLGSISDTFDGIAGLLDRFKGKDDVAKQILNIGIAIGILAVSLLLLSSIKPEALSTGIKGLTSLFVEIGVFMLALKEMSGANGKSLNPINKIATTLVKIAGAMVVFSLALKILASIKMEDMMTALIGFGGALAAIAGFMAIMKKVADGGKAKDIKRLASAVSGIAVGMLILSAALKVLSTMTMEQITNGLIAIVGFLGMVTVMYAAFDKMGNVNAGKILAVGASIAIISNAMLILSGAIGIISLIPLEGVIKAIAVIGSFMLIVSAMAEMSNKNVKGMLAAAGAIALIAPSLLVLAGVVAALGALKLTTLVKGLIGLGGAIAILGIGLKAMKGSLKGSAALLVASVALIALAPALAMLGALPLKNIAKALLALAGTFAVLWAGSVLLGPLTPALLALSGALIAFGAAVALAGVGFIALGAGLSMIAVSGVAGAWALVEALGIIITGIGKLGAEMVKATVVVIGAIVDGIVESIPKIVTGLGTVLLAILTYLDDNIETILNKFVDIILRVVGVITDRTPELVESGVNMIIAFINGLANSVREHESEITSAISNLIDSIIGVVFEFAATMAERIPAIGGVIASALRDVKATLTGSGMGVSDPSKLNPAKYASEGDKQKAAKNGELLLRVHNNPNDTEAYIALQKEMYRNGYSWSADPKKEADEFYKMLSEMDDETLRGWVSTWGNEIKKSNDLGEIQRYREAIKTAHDFMDNTKGPYGRHMISGPEETDIEKEARLKGENDRKALKLLDQVLLKTGLSYADEVEKILEAHPSLEKYRDRLPKFLQGVAKDVNEAKAQPITAVSGAANEIELAYSLDDLYSFGESKSYIESGADGILAGKEGTVGAAKKAALDTGNAYSLDNADAYNKSTSYVNSSKTGFESATPGAIAAVKTLVGSIKGVFDPKSMNMEADGENVISMYIKGIGNGLLKLKESLSNTGKQIADTIINKTKSIMQIKSPSRVGEEIGMYWDLGLAGGMTKYADSIDKASNATVTSLLGNIRSAVNSATGMLSDEIANNDGLNPVLGINDSIRGIRRLGSVIDSQNGGYLRKRYERPILPPVPVETNTKNYGGFTINVTTPDGLSPKEVAQYVMYEIQSEMERKEAALA